jgi:hypothetical protein
MTGLKSGKTNALHPQQHNEVFANAPMYVPIPQTLELLHILRWNEPSYCDIMHVI